MRKVVLRAGHYYHLYNRGVNRQPIYFLEEDRAFFIKRLRHYCRPELVDVAAYCLMPTHYHLLVYLKTDVFSRRVMQPFGVSYTKAINRQQDRVGPLFQGPFKAKLVDQEAYLIHLSRYIHLNPVSAGLVRSPADWSYSSYRDYIGQRQGGFPCPDVVLAEFASREGYRELVESGKDVSESVGHLLFD
jgi:REP element-mobilizing transposase RayT